MALHTIQVSNLFDNNYRVELVLHIFENCHTDKDHYNDDIVELEKSDGWP
jgi:hypothetical protein